MEIKVMVVPSGKDGKPDTGARLRLVGSYKNKSDLERAIRSLEAVQLRFFEGHTAVTFKYVMEVLS